MSGKTPLERAANARRQRRARRLKAAGLWQPFMDAEPVRAHLRLINEAGMSYAAICQRLELPQSNSLQHLLWGRGGGPGQQVRRETAELILAYWPSPSDFPDCARIDPMGTRRRVDALAVRGFSRVVIAGRIGMDATHFKKVLGRDRVTARVARAVAAVYDEWWEADPLLLGFSPESVGRTRANARRAGLVSALAWDDDTIDDPRAVPVTDAPAPAATDGENLAARWLMGESVILDAAARKEVVLHLYEWTALTGEEIAVRLETTPAAVEQTWNRAKRKARAEGRRLWRRVYVPQERQIKRDEMGEAA